MLVNLEGEDEMLFASTLVLFIINVFFFVRLIGFRVIVEILFIVSILVLSNAFVVGKGLISLLGLFDVEFFESVFGLGELVSLTVFNEVEVFFYEVSFKIV